MTGTAVLGLILLSMGWLLFLGGLALHYQLVHRRLKAKPGERVPSGFSILPGVIGSVTVFNTLPALAKYGIDVPWPWLWILLPLVLDPYCVPIFVLLLFRPLRK